MGKSRFSPHTRRFAYAPRSPCLYAAELNRPEGVLIKVGVSGNALGRMMSLQNEVKREHGAVLGRVAIFTTPTTKAAYEAESRVVNVLTMIGQPIAGRREFFDSISFEDACIFASETVGVPCWADVGSRSTTTKAEA